MDLGYDIWKLASPYDSDVICKVCSEVIDSYKPEKNEYGEVKEKICSYCED